MSQIFFFLLSALVPIVFFCFFIYLRDTEKEPISSLVKAFLLGCVILIPVVIVEAIFTAILSASGFSGSLKHFLDAFGIAGFVEEGFKLLALLFFVRKNIQFDQRYDGIVYAAFISLGFASIENIMYIFEYGFQTAIMRAFMAIPAHMFFAVFMGYHISLAHFGKLSKKNLNLVLALMVPLIIHGLYDYFLFDIEQFPTLYFAAIIVLCIGMWIIGLKRIRTHIAYDRSEIKKNGQDSLKV